ncbi:MAG: PAS domain-containing protein [Spirochaetes bacterium]|nr:PAS domain-containing protein [Spirochaetota bacterium]
MKPINFDSVDKHLDLYMAEYGSRSMSYPELCSEFLTILAKSIKSTALYTLSHPVVIESLRKDYALLNMIFAAKKENSFTLSFMNDGWFFNDILVPAVTQESQNLNAFFKTHGIHNLIFLNGAQFFELGALCEFLSASSKNQPEGYFREFLAQKGVHNIRSEEVRYIKEKRFDQEESAYERTSASMFEESPGTETVKSAEAVPRKVPRMEDIFAPEMRPQTAPRPQPVRHVPEIMPKPAPQAESVRLASEMRPRPASQSQPVKTAVEKMSGPEAKSMAEKQPKKPEENVLTSMSFGIILSRIVESAVKSPQERVNVYKDVLKLIRNSIKQEVDKTTKALAGENKRILNTRTRTENVLSKVAEGKVILDKEGNILMMNPAAEEISGKKFIDVVGKHISEHVKPGEHFLAISKDMDMSGGDTISGEVDVVGDIHVERSMRHSMALLEDDEGRVVGAYTTLPEITKFKETQRLQEEFLSRITHDLQTPLSSVSSALEMLTESSSVKLDPVERKFLDISIRNSLRLNRMIRGILDFSKIQSGKIDIHPEPASVADMLSEAGEGLLPWAQKRELTLIVRLPSPDIYAMADHQRIVQVLTNLISNAVKSTPKGGTVTVAASQAQDRDHKVIIGVKDTGKGIKKEDLKKVFDKFVQLGASSEPYEGVGLGLSIVNEFVKLHGGKVWANSELGKGSTFYFTLPMSEENLIKNNEQI